MIHHNHQQGSPEWLAARRGVVTGSRFKNCRDFKAPTAAQKKEGITRGDPSNKLLCYAYDIARERCGGEAPAKFQSAAMRLGTEQEAIARAVYERRTRNLVEEVGFITTDDGLFGLSPDGLIDDDGVLEIKTMVSSDTLFTAVAEGDVSEYMDQCLGYLWLLGRKWVDLVLWAPDLQHMTIRRIERDENAIEALEADLLDFGRRVAYCEAKLRIALADGHVPDAPPALAEAPEPEAADLSRVVVPLQQPAAPAATTQTATLTVGAINARLGFTMTAEFIKRMGLEPAATDKAAKLYTEGQFQTLCDSLVAHIRSQSAMAQQEAA